MAVVAGGERFEIDSFDVGPDGDDEAGHRYVTNLVLPHLGPTTRTLGLDITAGECVAELTLLVDRSLWSTVVGRTAVAVTALFGLLTVLTARLRRGGWLRRFLFAAPSGAVAGAGQAVVLYEAGMLDPFGVMPWWGPAAGLGAAALLPLTRWPRGASVPPAEARDEQEQPTRSGRAGALVSVATAVAVAVAIGAVAVLLDSRPAEARPVVITPEQAEVVFLRTVSDGLAQRYDHISLDVRSSVHSLVTTHDRVTDGRPRDIEVGVPADQHAYPAWFVGWALISYDGATASVFARFGRDALDEPWRMTGFIWSAEADLAPPLRDSQGWLAAEPPGSRLVVDPDELAERYVVWQGRQFVTVPDLDSGEVVDDDLLALHPDGPSYLRGLADWPDDPTSPAEVVVPSGVPFDETDGSGEGFFRYHVSNRALPDVAELSVVPLADGTAAVSFVLTAHRTVANVPDGSDSCDVRPSFEHGRERYRVFATDYRILVTLWVPLGAADGPDVTAPDPTGSPAPDPTGSPAPDPTGSPALDHGVVLDAAGEPLTVLVTDQVIGTDRPSERSEPC